jgi:hypothetical protein
LPHFIKKVATTGKKWQKVAESSNLLKRSKPLPVAPLSKIPVKKLPLLLKIATF